MSDLQTQITPETVQNVIAQVQAFLVYLWAQTEVKALLAAIAANTVLAVAVALKNGTANFKELFDFLSKDVLPKVITWATLDLTGDAIGLPGVGPAVAAGLMISLGARIAGQLIELGVQVPERVARMVGK